MSSSPPHQQHTPCRTYGSMLLHMLREFAWKWLARTLLPAAVVAQLHAAKKYSTNQYAGLATVRLGTFSVDCFQWSPLRWIQKSDQRNAWQVRGSCGKRTWLYMTIVLILWETRLVSAPAFISLSQWLLMVELIRPCAAAGRWFCHCRQADNV